MKQHPNTNIDLVSETIQSGPRSAAARPTRRNERGEGVISTAIAVLIVAFLGIALWQGFDGMVTSATTKTRAQVEQIGR